MLNNVSLVGRLTKDPELKYTQGGVAIANFTLAVNRSFPNKDGEREADFILCQVWRKKAESFANFMRKGSLVGVEGRIQTRNFEGQDGKRVYMTEVVADNVHFLEPRGGNGNPQDGYQGQQQQQQQQGQGGGGNNQQQAPQQQNNFPPVQNQQSGNYTQQPPQQQGGGYGQQGGGNQQQNPTQQNNFPPVQNQQSGNYMQQDNFPQQTPAAYNDDPFAGGGGPIQVQDDDLPF